MSGNEELPDGSKITVSQVEGFTTIKHPNGGVTVVDQAMMNYLNSAAPDPSQRSLDAVLNETRQVRVFRGGAAAGEPLEEDVLFATNESEALSQLRSTLQIMDGPGGHCMCHGDPTIELLGISGDRLAVISSHHGYGIRWNAWKDDARLVEERLLLEWFAAHGVTYPLEAYYEAQRRREASQLDWERWLETMPSCLKPFAEQLSDWTNVKQDTELWRQALEETYPDPTTRALVLFAWFGRGAGPWCGFPSYETNAEELLRTLPIDALLCALESTDLTDAHLEGAARFFAFADKRRRARLPDSMKRRLLSHSIQSVDPGNRFRAQAVFRL